MKHKLVVIISVAVVVVLAVACVRVWHNQKFQVALHQAIVTSQQNAKKRAQAAAVETEQQRINAECQKELTYYNTLTPTQKAKLTAPECNLQLVQ